MNLAEVSELLGVCAEVDGRILTSDTAPAWLLLLEDIPAEDAANAVRQHYRTDTRRIMPADIVTHHHLLEAPRALQETFRQGLQCWGCTVRYAPSGLEGSVYALPRGEHDQGCRAMQGILVFDDRAGGRWGVMPIDAATFDEAGYVDHDRQLKAAANRWRALNPGEETPPDFGAPVPAPEDLAVARRALARGAELADGL